MFGPDITTKFCKDNDLGNKVVCFLQSLCFHLRFVEHDNLLLKADKIKP